MRSGKIESRRRATNQRSKAQSRDLHVAGRGLNGGSRWVPHFRVNGSEPEACDEDQTQASLRSQCVPPQSGGGQNHIILPERSNRLFSGGARGCTFLQSEGQEQD